MSNKIVPQIYRQIIDDVMANVAADFDEYGMEEDVLINLQAKWEAKLLETRVADFNRAPNAAATGDDDSEPETTSRASASVAPSPVLPSGAGVAGPSSRPYQAYQPGMMNGGLALPSGMGMGGGQGLALPGQYLNQRGANGDVRVKQEVEEVLRPRGGASYLDDSKPVKAEVKPEPNAAGLFPGDEIIDSDLDDSDDEARDEGDDEGDGEVDIVFCTYDKVQRVKNKWKTTFKDGMVHINGRDYLFQKCNGEFEW